MTEFPAVIEGEVYTEIERECVSLLQDSFDSNMMVKLLPDTLSTIKIQTRKVSCMPHVYPVSLNREPCDRIQIHRDLALVNSGEHALQCSPVSRWV